MKNGFPTDWRAGSLASIYASPWQSVDQIQRLVRTAFTVKTPTKQQVKNTPNANKKAHFTSSERLAVFTTSGLEKCQSGLSCFSSHLLRALQVNK